MTKTYGNLVLIATICVAVFWVFMALRPAHAGQLQKDGTWAMSDNGRFHGYIPGRGALMPKCNPWVSPECARLHPVLFKIVPRPR